MTPLETRKQLLIVESELNRAQLAGDVAALRADIRALSNRAKSIGSIASTVAMVVSALAAFRRDKPARADGKRSWLDVILKSAGLISNLWMALRSPARDRE
ncbi:MAG: hypothetical protein ACLQU4_01885 [Limisphaerales bacterium]